MASEEVAWRGEMREYAKVAAHSTCESSTRRRKREENARTPLPQESISEKQRRITHVLVHTERIFLSLKNAENTTLSTMSHVSFYKRYDEQEFTISSYPMLSPENLKSNPLNLLIR